MKLHALVASAVALALAFISPAFAAENTPEQDFVALATISYVVTLKCPGYEFIDGGARKAADKQGVAFDDLGPAVANAINIILDEKYDREKLIPWVTKQVRFNLVELINQIGKNQQKFCNRFGSTMVNVGFMKGAK